VGIREVQNEHIRLEGFTLDQRPRVKIHVVNHTHGNKIRFRWMKLDAGDSLSFTVVVFNEGSLLHLSAIDFASGCSFFVAKHLEIVLEHIDDFI